MLELCFMGKGGSGNTEGRYQGFRHERR